MSATQVDFSNVYWLAFRGSTVTAGEFDDVIGRVSLMVKNVLRSVEGVGTESTAGSSKISQNWDAATGS